MNASVNHTALYAIQAVTRLAQEPESRMTAARLAQLLELPRNYLSKVLHALAQAGLLESVRGPHGGFKLAKAPGKIRLADVTAPFLSGSPAPVWWLKNADHTTTFLRSTTLQTLANAQASKTIKGGKHVNRRRTK